jgi:hypothetical protein
MVDHTVLGEDFPRSDPLTLAFAEPVHGFIALDGPLRGVECSKPQPRIHTAFHKSGYTRMAFS